MGSTKQEAPSATVILKGTQIGTSTNMQGNYQLVIPYDTATLMFLFIGFKPLKKKIVVTQDTTILPPVYLKEDCTLDYFEQKHVELSFISGLRYTPLGGKIKALYPFLIHTPHGQGHLRAEFSYQFGSNNFQRNATLAIDNAFIDCDNSIDITTDYQSVRLGEQELAYTRYTAGATYTGKLISRTIPIYLAVGGLSYSNKENTSIRTGVEIGANYPLAIYLSSSHSKAIRFITTGRIAWWQDYWQFQSSIETQIKRFSFKINFNKLSQYTEVNTGIGFRIERRYRVKH
ncbi:hypothetical protein GCM10023172_12100 [Hymenobacter ginsengisoli]|uniref:Outer membrane protein beta-barrel domain-containing protein n=2 Tax=Hymenobacteraceae TaxID=1853232 RepID=A0ABP8Q6Y1_9BACT